MPVKRSALRSRISLASVLLLVLSMAAAALSVHIAPLVVLDSESMDPPLSFRPQTDLLGALDATPLTGSVDFSPTKAGAVAPASFLDAARLCELNEYPYLIYGFIRRQESTYSSELKLIAREGKRIAASFVATDDAAHYERLIGDLSKKIAEYFLKDLAVMPGEHRDETLRNIFELPFSLGYWTPVGAWAAGTMGLACIDLGYRFIPKKPLAAIKSKPLYLGAGVGVEYALGKNRSGFETSFLHRIKLRLPVEAYLGLGGGNYVGAGLGGLAEFDLLSQDRKYGDAYVATSSAGGMSASLIYQYALSGRVALGLELEFDAVFYAQPLYALSPRLFANYTLGKKPENE
jgi:hypothetical protein